MNTLKKLYRKYLYGQILTWILNALPSLGINISLFYLLLEGDFGTEIPMCPDDFKGFTFGILDEEEIGIIANIPRRGIDSGVQIERHKKGMPCFGVKSNGEIVAFNWANLKECHSKWHRFSLKEDEAYLFDMYTLKSHRGKNIAPFLRHRTYRALKGMGKTKFYSYSSFLNKSAVRFKKKLNARILKLYLFVELFGMFERSWVLKNYKK